MDTHESNSKHESQSSSSAVHEIMEKLQDSYFKVMSYSHRSNEANASSARSQYAATTAEHQYSVVQSLYSDFLKLNHKEIFMYIMDTKDEVMKVQSEYK